MYEGHALHPYFGDTCSEGRIGAVWAHVVYSGMHPPKGITRCLSLCQSVK